MTQRAFRAAALGVALCLGPLRGDGAQVLPVVAQVEGMGELLARPQPGLGHKSSVCTPCTR